MKVELEFMPEQLKSISEARKNLPTLSQTVRKRMARYIITHQGQPQSVLLGYQEYQSMKAAVQLLARPEAIEGIKRGLKDLAEGRLFSSDEMRRKVAERSKASKKQADAVSERSKTPVTA